MTPPELTVELENRTALELDGAALCGLLRRTLLAEGVGEGDVGLVVVAAGEMADLNGLHRGNPQPTDVLSFPIDEDDPLPAGVPRQLGDIVVCPEIATAEGTPLELLVIHGALHLLGYDHETDAGEMLARQAELAGAARIGA